ncbi:N-acetylneuraminate synthase [Brevibacillus invocatus]|uniref:N-acetylneuraminate synthase n=1 Tax=Brevibacillus invocatus TaxID=173959 RepID=UPI00203F24E8|nr:N-acetylneuraminate synthase [Brevibacillus invocatus]MCM3079668.1 N-acetylneuraminate synthase [Brevibacillus invocatus]MCM3431122.1 N-acetylneuraminate synthase [Brevibacillus invocatus]
MKNTYIIAEAGVNHNGSLDMAIELVNTAATAGADAVKFQTFKSEHLVSKNAEKAEYQKVTTGSEESQLEMLKKLELDYEAHRLLINHCNSKKIQFLSTPFDKYSADFLIRELDVPVIKISSGDLTNAPLLLQIAQTGKPVILSTGMSKLGEIETALSVLAFGYTHTKQPVSLSEFDDAFFSDEGQHLLRNKVTILHCTTEYPTPFEAVNLRAMDTLRDSFHLRVGLSDHTQGISVAIAAVARGASVIEKHFTLDKNLPGPDHKASLDPVELNQMVTSIREVECALGNVTKVPTIAERKNKEVAQKSLVAACEIKEGEIFTKDNLTVKRPSGGISPLQFWSWLGKTADRTYQVDEMIRE